MQADSSSSLTFGRGRSITETNAVPLPPRSPEDSASYDAFVSACELAYIVEDLHVGSLKTSSRLAQLCEMSAQLDAWKSAVDRRGLLSAVDEPGVRSLHLLYLGCCLMTIRAISDALDEGQVDAEEATRHSCLTACEDICELIGALTPLQLGGYWSSRESDKGLD